MAQSTLPGRMRSGPLHVSSVIMVHRVTDEEVGRCLKLPLFEIELRIMRLRSIHLASLSARTQSSTRVGRACIP